MAGRKPSTSTDTPSADSADVTTQAAPAPTLPRYVEYLGELRGSVFGADGEPIGRVERGSILRLDTADALARVQDVQGNYLADWKGTTAARFNEQEAAAGRLMTEADDGEATSEARTPADTDTLTGTEADASAPTTEGSDLA